MDWGSFFVLGGIAYLMGFTALLLAGEYYW